MASSVTVPVVRAVGPLVVAGRLVLFDAVPWPIVEMLDRLRAWIHVPAARPILDPLFHMSLSFVLPRPQLEALVPTDSDA